MKRIVRQLLLAFPLLTIGCGTQSAGERTAKPFIRPGEFGAAGCFTPHLASDFAVLDDRNLIVFAPTRSDAYHVQVSPPSPDLRFANSLAFDTRNSRVCGYAGDTLLVAGGASHDSRYAVTGVYRLDERALEGLRARFGKGQPPPTATPEQGEGAAIERELEKPESD